MSADNKAALRMAAGCGWCLWCEENAATVIWKSEEDCVTYIYDTIFLLDTHAMAYAAVQV